MTTDPIDDNEHRLDTTESWLGGPYWCMCGRLVNSPEHREARGAE